MDKLESEGVAKEDLPESPLAFPLRPATNPNLLVISEDRQSDASEKGDPKIREARGVDSPNADPREPGDPVSEGEAAKNRAEESPV